MKYVLPLVALGLFAGPVYSGGYVPSISPVPAPIVEGPASNSVSADWTSNYAGVMLGYGRLEREVGQGPDTRNGGAGAAFVGHMRDFGTWVGAVELMAAPGFGADVAGREVKWAIAARGKAGVKFGPDSRWLGFATLGFGRGKTEADSGSSRSANGYLYGLGLNYLVSETVVIGSELLRAHKTGDGDADATGIGFSMAYRF